MKWSLRIVFHLVTLFAFAHPAEAQSPAGCVAAFDAAQGLRAEGKLLGSRDQLVACAQVSCPTVIQQKCNEWLVELEKVTPSIVLTIDPTPTRPTEVVVVVDGKPVDGQALGRALSIDPGHHDVVVTLADGTETQLKVMVAHGEQNRKIVVQVSVPAPTSPESRQPERSASTMVSPWVWVGFGISAASLITGAITGGVALTTAEEVRASCGGSQCDASHDDDIGRGETLSHVSTVSFAVAGVGAVVGIVGIALSLGTDESIRTVGVHPWIGLGGAGIRGAF